MPVDELLLEGLNLMLIGMGMVFAFLAILIVLMQVMSRAARAMAAPEGAPTAAAGSGAVTDAEDGELIAVITAAINRYRSEK